MTNRDFYTAIVNTETLSEELRQFATDALQKMDERNAKRSSKPSKTAVANEPIKTAILAALTDEPQTAPDLAAIVGDGVTHNKVTALARQLVAEGKATVTEVKVPKKGKMKGYAIVTIG